MLLYFKRTLKRPYQQFLFVVWSCILFSFLLIGLHRVTPAGSSNTRRQHQTPVKVDPSLKKELKAAGYGDEDSAHPRLHQRPLPVHGSKPDFPNIPVAVHISSDDGSHIKEEDVQNYIDSIWDLGHNMFWRTECDHQGDLTKRYQVLKELADNHKTSQVKYFFALDLFQVKDLLPRLMGSLIQVMKMLGPEKCAISVIEGRSSDGTYAILQTLKDKVETIGGRFYLDQSSLDPKGGKVDRIEALSELRNLALRPLIEGSKNTTGIPTYDNDTIIAFVNDIAVCPDDIYELLFQHHFQKAHQTCAMDWVNGGNLFYDSWVSRSMSGDLFFEVPQDVSFYFADNLFWDHPHTKDKFKRHQPFQVYSCWGGMVTLSSAPFIDGRIKIRGATKDECYSGEPTTLAKDLWKFGYGKILTVPTVNVGYNNQEGSRIKRRRGQVSKYVDTGKTEAEWKGTELIEWKEKPPGQVKCMPGWGVTSWTEP